jgi:outer membrane protein OmpA-like peptidoglycan-associated protein
MKTEAAIAGVVGAVLLAGTVIGVRTQVDSAKTRLERGLVVENKPQVAVADDAEASYCTPKFKEVLARVLHACGLVNEQRRGCQPADIQRLAEISDEEFNELFAPLEKRGGVVLFDDNSNALDESGKKLVEELWADRRGARYFFVVARASKTGTPEYNRKLSNQRANSVRFFVEDDLGEKELDKLMGTLWLGNDFAQLGPEYCKWNVSRNGKPCNGEAVNRSAFVSWVDCRL